MTTGQIGASLGNVDGDPHDPAFWADAGREPAEPGAHAQFGGTPCPYLATERVKFPNLGLRLHCPSCGWIEDAGRPAGRWSGP